MDSEYNFHFYVKWQFGVFHGSTVYFHENNMFLGKVIRMTTQIIPDFNLPHKRPVSNYS